MYIGIEMRDASQLRIPEPKCATGGGKLAHLKPLSECRGVNAAINPSKSELYGAIFILSVFTVEEAEMGFTASGCLARIWC